VWICCCRLSISVYGVRRAVFFSFVFVFQAEDGIRDRDVTGVHPVTETSPRNEVPPCMRKRSWDAIAAVYL